MLPPIPPVVRRSRGVPGTQSSSRGSDNGRVEELQGGSVSSARRCTAIRRNLSLNGSLSSGRESRRQYASNIDRRCESARRAVSASRTEETRNQIAATGAESTSQLRVRRPSIGRRSESRGEDATQSHQVCPAAHAASHRAHGEILVYLDVDGVLNTTAQRSMQQRLDPELIANLRSVFDAVPGVALMLSTSWRSFPPLVQHLKEQLSAGGIAPPVGATGHCDMPPSAQHAPHGVDEMAKIEHELAQLAEQRTAEIIDSVRSRRPLAWIAIDDLDLLVSQLHVEDAQSTSARQPPAVVRRTSSQRRRPPMHTSRSATPRPHSTRPRSSSLLDQFHFVHTSEAEGLTTERAAHAVALLQVQITAAQVD